MSTKLSLLSFTLFLFTALPTFGSGNEILRADDGEDNSSDCGFTQDMFNAIRKELSCPTVKACRKCNLCCINFEDYNTSKIFPNTLQLMCHSDRQITVEWSGFENVTIVYLTKLYKTSENNALLNYEISKRNHTSFYDLENDTKYLICVWAFDQLGQIGGKICNNFKTLKKDITPDTISKAWAGNTEFIFSNNTLQLEIKWEPGKDRVCNYEIWVMRSDIFYMALEIDVPNKTFSSMLTDLEYGASYKTAIRGINSYRFESEIYWLNFTIPTCLKFHKTLDYCPPSLPTNIEVVEEISKIQPDNFNKNNIFYNVIMNWTPPEPKPTYYIVNITNTNNRALLVTQNVNGNKTSTIIKNVPLSKDYKVTMVAGSKGGISMISHVDCEIEYPEKDSLLWTVIAPVFGFIIVLCLMIFIYRRNEKVKLINRRRQYFEDLEQKAPKEEGGGSNFTICPNDDPYEIISEKVIMFEILGEGAFGIVRKGWIPEHNKEVAVKMLKDDPSAEEVKQFRQEIDMMKAVGSHAHIVSLVGCCTCPSSTMMLIVEYCTLGDLQNYLRAAWDKMSSKESSRQSNTENTNSFNENTSGPIKYAELVDSENNETSKISNFIINKIYDLEQNIEEAKEADESDISPADLLSFARQIAMGMEFLSSSRVIHRDLAARNVLVCANKTVKIADFGLSRDIYQENIYRKRSSGKLPIKWMAIESLTHQMYTTQSDVWSYGVLLWEIVTLGSTPYPSIPTGKLLKLLLSGYRMECPVNCSSEIYNIMHLCWRTRPKDRPSFTEIRQKIDLLLEGVCLNSYLSLDILENIEKPDIRRYSSDDLLSNIDNSQNNYEKSDSEGYVRPITITKNNLTTNVQLQHNNKPVFISNNKQVQANNVAVNNFNLLSNRISYPISEKKIDEKPFYCKENDNFNIKSNYKSENHSINYLNGNGNYYASQNIVLTTKLN